LITVVSTVRPSPSCCFFSLLLFPQIFLPCCETNIIETKRSSSYRQASPDRLFNTIKGVRDQRVRFSRKTINLLCWDQANPRIKKIHSRNICVRTKLYINYIIVYKLYIVFPWILKRKCTFSMHLCIALPCLFRRDYTRYNLRHGYVDISVPIITWYLIGFRNAPIS